MLAIYVNREVSNSEMGWKRFESSSDSETEEEFSERSSDDDWKERRKKGEKKLTVRKGVKRKTCESPGKTVQGEIRNIKMKKTVVTLINIGESSQEEDGLVRKEYAQCSHGDLAEYDCTECIYNRWTVETPSNRWTGTRERSKIMKQKPALSLLKQLGNVTIKRVPPRSPRPPSSSSPPVTEGDMVDVLKTVDWRTVFQLSGIAVTDPAASTSQS